MIRSVRLYGSLARDFGPVFRLDVHSVAEAVRAVAVQVEGFRAAIESGRFRIICGPSTSRGLGLTEDTLTFGLPAGDIHVVPVVRGRGGRGASIGKIIVGTILAVASFSFGIPILGSIGVSLALSGVAGLLAPKKKAQKERRSFMVNDGANGTQQGSPVPWISGRTMVTGINISSGVTCSIGNGLATVAVGASASAATADASGGGTATSPGGAANPKAGA